MSSLLPGLTWSLMSSGESDKEVADEMDIRYIVKSSFCSLGGESGCKNEKYSCWQKHKRKSPEGLRQRLILVAN